MGFEDGIKFSDWIKSRISWFITLIIATVLSMTVVNMKDIILKFEILFAILIGAAFSLLFIYSNNFYKDYTKIMNSERVPMDAILKVESKKVIFDDATFSDNEAEVKLFRKLFNNMTTSNETYDRYKVIIKSGEDVPHLDDITLTRNKKDIKLSKLDKKISQPMRCLEIDSSTINGSEISEIIEPIRKNVEFFVPLHIKSGKTCNFEVKYRTKAYENAIHGLEDFTQVTVNRITNQLIINILLEGEMKNKFKVAHCAEEDGTVLSYKIFDASEERMKKTESQITEPPKYKGSKAIWEIKNPKIGYRYRMYFRLLPCDKYV